MTTMREVVLEASGLLGGSSARLSKRFCAAQPGIHHTDASPVSGTVTVGFAEASISQAKIERLIQECGLHCRGEVVPRHVCAPPPEAAVTRTPAGAESSARTTQPPPTPGTPGRRRR